MPKNWKIINSFLLLLTFEFCLLSLGAHFVRALDMSSSYYKIKSGSLNISPNSGKDSTSHTRSDSFLSSFNTAGFAQRTGLTYLKSSDPFTFSISDTHIEFVQDTLSDNIKSAQVIINNGPTSGFQFFLAQKDRLTSADGLKIADTKCDDTKNPCSPTSASSWTNNQNYGYGYSILGKNIPPDFKNSSYFRPFANLSQGDKPVSIISSPNHKFTYQLTINFKLNTSISNDKNKYQNELTFYAIPGY